MSLKDQLLLFFIYSFQVYAFRTNIAFWNPANSCITNVSSNLDINGQVNAIANNGDVIYIGGNFSQVKGIKRNNIAAIDLDGNVLPFDPNLNGNVSSLLFSDNKLFVGGDFTLVGNRLS